jgi:hypothetical protein
MPGFRLIAVQTLLQDCVSWLSQQLQKPMASLRSAVTATPKIIPTAMAALSANERTIPNPVSGSVALTLAAKFPCAKAIDHP